MILMVHKQDFFFESIDTMGDISLLGEVHGSLIGDGDLEAVLAGVATASDAAVGDARHSGHSAGHEVQLGEIHRRCELAGDVHGTLTLQGEQLLVAQVLHLHVHPSALNVLLEVVHILPLIIIK
jgi:hypothetical protein